MKEFKMTFRLTKNNTQETFYRLLSHKGFTLAEILIALVVIGVLATMLAPTIQQLIPNSNTVLFKKAYSTLNTAITNMINDEINYPSDQTGTDSGETVPRGFNFTDFTTNTNPATGLPVNKFCYFLTDQLSTTGTPYCPPATGSAFAGWTAGQFGTFTTSDGISWKLYFRDSDASPNTQFPMTALEATGTTDYSAMVFIDVNGDTKGPNCTAGAMFGSGALIYPRCASTTNCSSNPDVFVIGVRYDGKLIVGGYHGDPYTDLCANSILSNPTNNR